MERKDKIKILHNVLTENKELINSLGHVLTNYQYTEHWYGKMHSSAHAKFNNIICPFELSNNFLESYRVIKLTEIREGCKTPLLILPISKSYILTFRLKRINKNSYSVGLFSSIDKTLKYLKTRKLQEA